MIDLVECPHCATRVLPMAGRVCPACRRDVDAPPEPAPPESVVADAYGFAAGQMRHGVAPSGIEQGLTDRGLDAGEASSVVRHLKRAHLEARQEAGRKNMLHGALWCFGGIGVTALTHQAAANSGGGRVVIAWGAILFGAIQFVRGLVQSAAE